GWRPAVAQALVKGVPGALLGLGAGFLSADGSLFGWLVVGALLWSVPSLVHTVSERHRQPVWCVALSPRGDFALSASVDGNLGLWQLEDRSLIGFVPQHGGLPISSVAFAPDGQTCVSGGADGTLRVVDGASGEQTLVLSGHTDTVLAVAFAANQDALVSGSADGTVRVWNVQAGREKACCQGHTAPV